MADKTIPYRKFLENLNENVQLATTQVAEVPAATNLDYGDLHRVEDPSVLSRLNTFLGAVGDQGFADPLTAMNFVARKLMISAHLTFPVVKTFEGDKGKMDLPLSQFGGIFENGKVLDGISHRMPGGKGLVLRVNHSKENGQFVLKLEIVPGKANTEPVKETSLKPNDGKVIKESAENLKETPAWDAAQGASEPKHKAGNSDVVEYRNKNGELHRLDGPAVYNIKGGMEQYWIGGKKFSKPEWVQNRRAIQLAVDHEDQNAATSGVAGSAKKLAGISEGADQIEEAKVDHEDPDVRQEQIMTALSALQKLGKGMKLTYIIQAVIQLLEDRDPKGTHNHLFHDLETAAELARQRNL